MGEILRFLERRRLHNAWVLWFVWDTLRDPHHPGEVLVCRSGSKFAGVAYLGQRPLRDEKAPAHFDVHMDAENPEAARALAEALPPGSIGRFQLFTAETQEYFDGIEGPERHEDDVYYTVSQDGFRPTAGPEVVELTESDAALFARCEHEPRWEYRDEESTLFAIVEDRSVAASVSVTPITPKGATTPCVVSIGALHTEGPHRRQGLGRRVVSCATELVLNEGNLPIYWTAPDNIAPQRLCEGLGYWQYAQKVNYVWRRPEVP